MGSEASSPARIGISPLPEICGKSTLLRGEFTRRQMEIEGCGKPLCQRSCHHFKGVPCTGCLFEGESPVIETLALSLPLTSGKGQMVHDTREVPKEGQTTMLQHSTAHAPLGTAD